MFKFKAIAKKAEMTVGFFARILGADFSILLLGNFRDWQIVDIRLPFNYGIYCQLGFLLVSLGRLEGIVYELE